MNLSDDSPVRNMKAFKAFLTSSLIFPFDLFVKMHRSRQQKSTIPLLVVCAQSNNLCTSVTVSLRFVSMQDMVNERRWKWRYFRSARKGINPSHQQQKVQ